jgi:hypothetical protein
MLLELVPSAESLSARPIPAEPRLVALLRGTVDLGAEYSPYLDPLAREAVSRHLVDLIALTRARGDTAELARGRGLAACGFGDLSTFNRAFRRRFGATPSDKRIEGLRRSGIISITSSARARAASAAFDAERLGRLQIDNQSRRHTYSV